MRRFRLSSLLFVIVIAALVCALFVQQRRAAREVQELRVRLEYADYRAELERATQLLKTANQQIATPSPGKGTERADPKE